MAICSFPREFRLNPHSTGGPGLNIFQYSRSYGRDLLTVQEYAGVMTAVARLRFTENITQEQHVNCWCLIELSESPFRIGTLADLHAHDMPLFEIPDVLEHVGDIVRKGIARTYVSRQDNLIFPGEVATIRAHQKKRIRPESFVLRI